MGTFEVEELHVVLGAIEKRVDRTYAFKNLVENAGDHPKLVISDADRVVKEFMGDTLARVKKLDDRTVKLTFNEDRSGTMRKIIGKKSATVRTVRFAEEDDDLVSNFILACRRLNPIAEIDQSGNGDGDLHSHSDIESKTSHDTLNSSMRDSDSRLGKRSPNGSFDNVPGHGDGVEPTMIEQLGNGGSGPITELSTSSFGRFDPSIDGDDEVVTGVRAPPNSAAHSTLLQSKVSSEFMKEFSPLPKFFCRVRNRYGAIEGKLIGVGADEIRFLSLVEAAVAQEEVPTSLNSKGEEVPIDDGEEVIQMSSILASHPPSQSMSSMSIASSTANAEGTGAAVVKQELAYFWLIPKAKIAKFVLFGLVGSVALFVLEDGTQFDVSFEYPGARKHFVTTVFGSKDPRVVQLFPGGEECAVQDVQNGWSDFALVSLKGMGSVRTSRMFVLSRTDRCFWIFRNSDLISNLVCESCEPFRSIGVPSSGLSIEQVKSSRTRLKFGLSHTTTVASAPSSSSLVPSVKSDGSEKTHFDILFPNYFERERFVAHLQSLLSTVKLIAQPSELRAKFQRQAWHRPNLSWFEVKRSLFLGTFNVGDSAPPEPAVLDLWVAHPVKAKRDMINGGIRTQTRVRAKSGSAGVTGRFSVYVFGLQECGNKFDEWSKALQNHLGSDFCLVSSARLWEIGLLIFAALSEADKISCVETGTVATGRGIAKEVTGMQLGNKGGVAIGLKWRDTSLCFVNAHLAPHQEKSLIRNQNFSQIMAKLGLCGSAGDCGELGFEPTHSFEHTFFFGDLNYRVDESFQKVISIASQGKWSQLLAMDQLGKEMTSGRAYHGFREAGVPQFPPTYRWERNKRAFSNKKDQPPSYTDRVLIHSRPGLESKITSHLYGSSQDVMISDHRPVAATFSIALREPYTPWPLHPLVGEIPKKDQADESSGVGSGGGTSPLLENRDGGPDSLAKIGIGSSLFASQLEREMSREAGSDGTESSAPLAGRPVSLSKIQINPPFDPLYSLHSAGNDNADQDPQQVRAQELRDEDEEDEPDQFLGPLGSFFVTPESFATNNSPPEIRLSNLILKLEKKEGSDKCPPTFVQLRVSSKILQEVELLETSPGFEDLSKPTEFAFNLIPEGNSKTATWGDLYYTWNLTSPLVATTGSSVNLHSAATSETNLASTASEDSNKPAATNTNANSFTTLKPTVWDPCYLSTQHLLVAVEEISSARKKEEAKKKASVLDDEEGAFESPSSNRRTLTESGTKSASRVSARLSRRKRSVGSAAMQIGSAIATAVSGSTTFSGQVCIPLAEVVETVRKQVYKDAGMASWNHNQPISVEFEQPVVMSGVKVGEMKGTLSLVPGGADERRTFMTKRSALVGRVGGRQLEPVYCRQSYDIEVQLEGFNDKKGNSWRRVFVALDTQGTLYICSKAPGGNKVGQAMTDAMQRSALLILDANESALEYSVGTAAVADRPYTFEVTARKLFSSPHDTLQATNPRAIVVFSVNTDHDKRMWGTCIQAIQMQRRIDREFAKEAQRDCDERREMRLRRLEIERKRRYDAEQALLLAQTKQVVSSPVARTVQFTERPPEVQQETSAPPKSSFLSRAGLLLKKSNAKQDDFLKQTSFRERWFGGARSMQDVLHTERGEDDSGSGGDKRPMSHSTRSAAHSNVSVGDKLDGMVEEVVDEDIDKHLEAHPTEARSPSPSEAPAEPPVDEKKLMSMSQKLRDRAKNAKLRIKRQPSS